MSTNSVGVVVETPSGRGEGQMGQVEANTHKPRGFVSSAFAHDFDTVAGGMVVLVALVQHVGAFGGGSQVVFAPEQCVACAAHFPGRAAPGRSVLADPTMTIVHASAVVDLAGGGGCVAVGHKLLWEGYYVRDDTAHGCSQIPNLGRVGPQAGHQACARGAANGLLAVVVFKDHAACG